MRRCYSLNWKVHRVAARDRPPDRTVKVRKLVYQEIKEPPINSEVFHFYRIIKLNLKVNFILIQSGYCNRLFSSKKSMKPLIILSLRSSISFSVKSLKSSDIFLSP